MADKTQIEALRLAEHYRNAIATACEGWSMPDGLRKHLESALWNPPAHKDDGFYEAMDGLYQAAPSAAPVEPDPADIIAGALQISRGHAIEMMREALEATPQQAAPKAAPGEMHDHQILAITTAYEQGVGKGRQAHESGKEIANPYNTSYRCDLAWQYGYEEGKKQAKRLVDRPGLGSEEPIAWESTVLGYIKYVTQSKYEKFSTKVQRWYKPYKCSSCATLSDDIVKDAMRYAALRDGTLCHDDVLKVVKDPGRWEQPYVILRRGDELDSAIDAALAALEGGA